MTSVKSFIFVLIICCFSLSTVMADAPSARKQLQETIDKITGILTDLPVQEGQERKKQMALLCDLVYERFSLAKFSQLCLEDHWNNKTGAQKQAFIALFGKFLENSYMSKADRYQDEQVVFERDIIDNNRAQLHVKVVRGMLRIPVNVKMYQTNGGQWMVYDVVVFGVSLVRNYRAQFNHIIKRHSYERLIRIMEEKKSVYTGCACAQKRMVSVRN